MTKGRYVILSGGEGSGKSTVHQYLQTVFPDAVYVREPGQTTFAEGIRNLLLNPDTGTLTPREEHYLFMAARLHLMRTQVQPRRREGLDVISDRGWPETFAYQWWAGQQQKNLWYYFDEIERGEIPFPDLWLFFDVDPEIGLSRRQAATELNRIDAQDLDFHRRVREGFQYIFERTSFPRRKIDASKPLEEVKAETVKILRAFFEEPVLTPALLSLPT